MNKYIYLFQLIYIYISKLIFVSKSLTLSTFDLSLVNLSNVVNVTNLSNVENLEGLVNAVVFLRVFISTKSNHLSFSESAVFHFPGNRENIFSFKGYQKFSGNY